MMSTLTSPIALTTANVMQNAGIQNSQLPVALFTIPLSRVLDVENRPGRLHRNGFQGVKRIPINPQTLDRAT